jgi:hypothetical protein
MTAQRYPAPVRDSDLTTLAHALRLEEEHEAGIFPSGPGQASHFRRLVRLGHLAFEDYGQDIDGEHEREVPIYRLTDTGREIALAEARGEIQP